MLLKPWNVQQLALHIDGVELVSYTDITFTIIIFPMNTLASTTHIVEAIFQLQHLYMILASTCVPLLQFMNVIWFQPFKGSQPSFATMGLHKLTIEVQLHIPTRLPSTNLHHRQLDHIKQCSINLQGYSKNYNMVE